MNNAINWDEIPEVITKEQLYQICHISKSTALYLLQSGKIPCFCTGMKTRCYRIRKMDVIAYLENRKVFAESYSAPRGWYGGSYAVKMVQQVPPEVLEEMQEFYIELLAGYADVLTVPQFAELTGYGRTAINNWCKSGALKSFKRGNVNHIPKIYVIEFFCSESFRTITRKSDWHMETLRKFAGWYGKHGK